MSQTNSNGVDASTFWAMVRKELKHRKDIEDLRKKKTADRTHWRSLGVDLGDFDWSIKQLLAKDGGEGVIAQIRRRKEYLNHLNIPAGTQFSLFDEPAPTAKKTNREEKAFQSGFAAYVLGMKESDNVHGANTAEGQEWLRGFREAQGEIGKAEEILDTPPEEPATIVKAPKKGEKAAPEQKAAPEPEKKSAAKEKAPPAAAKAKTKTKPKTPDQPVVKRASKKAAVH